MAGTTSKRSYSPAARYGQSEKKKRIKTDHERHQSGQVVASPDLTRTKVTDSQGITSGQAICMPKNQSKNFSKEHNTTLSMLKPYPDGQSSNCRMKIKSSSSRPGHSGIYAQDDVNELRNWWTGLKSKGFGCDCGSMAIFDNFTTEYIREQLDAEYGINTSIQTAEEAQREKKVKEDRLRAAADFACTRWGRGKLSEDKSDGKREKTNNSSPKSKGKEKAACGRKKLGRFLGTASCPKCDICLCLGCLKPLQDSQITELDYLDMLDTKTLGAVKTGGSHLKRDKLWCCDEGRVAAIILVLACLDEDTLGISSSEHLNNNPPSRKGFGGAVKRGIRNLKYKITENTFQGSPSLMTRSKPKNSKGNGTGYGSGGYSNSGGLLGLGSHEPENWELDVNSLGDPDNAGPFTIPYSNTAPVGYAPYNHPSFPPSIIFPGPGKDLSNGSTTLMTTNGPPQVAGSSAANYIDLTIDDPPPLDNLGTIGPQEASENMMAFPSAVEPSSFAFQNQGTRKGGSKADKSRHFPGPGEILEGRVAGSPASNSSFQIPGGFSYADKLLYPLSSGWAHGFPQYPGAELQQRVLDDLLTHDLANPSYASPASAELHKHISGPGPSFVNLIGPPPPYHGGTDSGIPTLGRDRIVKSVSLHQPLSPEQTKHDKTLTAIMSALTELLPTPYWGSLFDLEPSPLLKVILKTSMLVEKAEELLRNDSIQDISIHSEMYITLMGLLRRICTCPNMEFLVIERQRKKLHTIGLLRIAQSPPVPDDLPERGPKTRGKVAAVAEENRRAEVLTYEDSSDRKTLVEVSENLCTQAKFFLKGAEKSEGADFDGTEATEILGICLEIVSIKEEFDKLALTTSNPNTNTSEEELFDSKDKHYTSLKFMGKKTTPLQLGFEYHSKNAFEYIENVLNTHHYKTQAKDLKQSPRGRVLHLTRELASMSTSLPQGIFVKVEDSRPDVLKILIVGPRGTPYEGGLYEFDVWAPTEYPLMPPLCIFKTTGGGSVHFNPNLYNCGKVCLSILNTWEGAASEKWQPTISTLLQVFVSIQSMILCDNPWYNEPGRKEGTQKKQSEEFNARVRLNNVRFAMLDWIKDPEKRNGIWKGVIKAHFIENGAYTMDLIRGWAKKGPSIRNWHHGVGSLYGGNPNIDYLSATAPGGKLGGEAAPSPPAAMDMVAEMEGLMKKLFGGEDED